MDLEVDLGPYAQPLYEALRVAVPEWVTLCLNRFGIASHGVQDAGEHAWESIAVALRKALDLSNAAPGPNPLAVLRRVAVVPTELLRAAGASLPVRDEFNVRRSPDDVYDLEPATWRDFGDQIHDLGIIWGAAKTHAHLAARAKSEA